MDIHRIKKPFIFTIFGASGDLAKLKLFPALYSLAEQRRLPPRYYIVGFSRTAKSEQEFRKEFSESIKHSIGTDLNPKILAEITANVHYFTGQYDKIKDFQQYREYLAKLTATPKNKTIKIPHLAYFSVPPQAFQPIIENLGKSRTSKNEDIRLIIEKPFGSDTKSATQLYHFLARHFTDDQVYLLDHFLGKSGVQSILNLRESNLILNMLLKGSVIANIQITASEDIGIKDRVGYFEQVGIIKDMIQSHLLQILALTTMSIPVSESAASLHREKYSILSALKLPRTGKNIVIGQYKGYKKEKDVPANSKTETFAAVKLLIDRANWFRVPIYIRTGKKLKSKHTCVVFEFKKFEFQKKEESPNLLMIEISPHEKIAIQLVNKHNTGIAKYERIDTSDSIACSGDFCLPEHGVLILDALRKNKMNFLSFEEILASWRVTEEILSSIKRQKIRLEAYDNKSYGPDSIHKITQQDGFKWHPLP